MYVHIRFPTTISGLGRVVPGQIIALTGAEAIPLIAAGNAVPDPELDELKERARKLGQNVDWAEQERFKRPRAAVIASAHSYYPPAEESFETKVVKAAKARAAASPFTRKAAEERAEKERSRYRKFRPRPHTESD